jgi:hypothetical protein
MFCLLKCNGISPFLQAQFSTFVVTLVPAGLLANDNLFLLEFVGVSTDTRLTSDSKEFGASFVPVSEIPPYNIDI